MGNVKESEQSGVGGTESALMVGGEPQHSQLPCTQGHGACRQQALGWRCYPRPSSHWGGASSCNFEPVPILDPILWSGNWEKVLSSKGVGMGTRVSWGDPCGRIWAEVHPGIVALESERTHLEF